MEKDIFQRSIYRNLLELSERFRMDIPDSIIRYISTVFSLYYKGIPLYLIDIKEKSTFERNKARGDVSLLLVGLFKEWINRQNRPLTENDYINAGKTSYLNAYMYLETLYGDMFLYEFKKEYIKDLTENIYSYLDILKSMSDNFEFYTEFLNIFREESKKMRKFLDTFPELRLIEMENFRKD